MQTQWNEQKKNRTGNNQIILSGGYIKQHLAQVNRALFADSMVNSFGIQNIWLNKIRNEMLHILFTSFYIWMIQVIRVKISINQPTKDDWSGGRRKWNYCKAGQREFKINFVKPLAFGVCFSQKSK